MDIDPRLRDTPSAGSYNLQPRPLNAQLPTPIAPQVSRSEAAIQHYQSFQASSPPNYYLPQTPQSGDNATDNDAADGNNDGGTNDPKRSRACEACRGLKVKCEPNPNGQDRPCKRCAKANRVCTTTEPTRKRQKKTDSRVAELERKVEDLTAMLAKNPAAHRMSMEEGVEPDVPSIQARPNTYQQVTNGSYVSGFSRSSESRSDDWGVFPAKASSDLDNRKASAAPMVVAGQKRKHVDPAVSDSPLIGVARKSVDAPNPPQSAFLMDAGSKRVPIHVYSDVIDRGLVTADQAAAMFDCYVQKMAPHMPAVVFELDTTMAQIRKTKPTLFLAILAASSGSNFPNIQKQLTKEVMAIYAERIIGNGEKNLELIQALQVSSLWYYPPEHFEELKFYQLIHIAAVMAIDIGLDRRSRIQGPGLWRDHQWRRTPYPESASIEARRAWLGCYFMCCNAAMGLRRPNLIRWTPFMQECVETLETSPDAAPSDRALCAWVQMQHISEQVGTAFCMDDPSANVSMNDSTVQYALKGFENSLENWSKEVLPQVNSRKSCKRKSLRLC